MFGVSLWEWWEKGQCAGEAVYEGIQVQSQAGPASLAQVSYAGGWNAWTESQWQSFLEDANSDF